MREEVIARIGQEKLIAIVRGVSPSQYLKVAEALYAGGVRLMEIAFDQRAPESFRSTADGIALIREKMGERMSVGAGTVLTEEQVELTAAVGGDFVISPDVDVGVIRRTVSLGLVSIPGAMTPTEIVTAHRAGADFVKLFPAARLGADYVKAVRGPLGHIRLLAVGGVNENNMGEFLRAGVSGFGVGGNLANRQWIEAGDLDRLTRCAKLMCRAAKTVAASGKEETT